MKDSRRPVAARAGASTRTGATSEIAAALVLAATMATAASAVLPAGAALAQSPPTSTISAADGSEIRVTPFVGASVQLEHDGFVMHVDPWSRGDYASARPADLVLVTDTPPDHLDPELILRIRRPDAPVILSDRPEEARDEGGRSRVQRVFDGVGTMARVLDNGDVVELERDPRERPDGSPADPIRVEAVAMYDLIPGEPFHARGEGNGYVVTLGGTRIYLSGVTECTDEMLAVEDVDVLFVPMNLPNGRMPPEAAAECVREIGPDIVYPYHYREQPIDAFVEALEEHPVEVRVFDWYSR